MRLVKRFLQHLRSSPPHLASSFNESRPELRLKSEGGVSWKYDAFSCRSI